MNFPVKTFFRIKVRIDSHLSKKSLTEIFIFCDVNIILRLSLASFCSNLIASLWYTLHEQTLDTD